MEYLTLKNSDLKVSRLCMGGCPMGGYGWGDVQEVELIEAVHTALDEGVTFFDTADTYGLGQSEKTLGRALGAHRGEVMIATKFGVRVGPDGTTYDNSPAYMREALDASLGRLGTDCVDLYQVHYRDGKTPIEELIDALEDVKCAGKIRHYGFSNLSQYDADELRPYAGRIVSFQDEYSLACRAHESDIQMLTEKLRLTPMTWGSLGQGILTGKYTKDSVFGSDDRRSRDIYVNFHGAKLQKNLDIVEVLNGIASAHNVSVAAAAIRFILDHLPKSVVLVGAKRPSQIKGNCESMGWRLTDEELKALDEVSR